MKNFLTFEQFITESYLISEGGVWPMYNGSFKRDKLKNGELVKIYSNDTLGSNPTVTSSGKSLGVKVNWVSTERDRSEPRYIAARILNGPNKGTVLFCETVFEPRQQDSWYSVTPGKYKFKTEELDVMAIPADLKAIHDELIEKI
jgi:hypothetical protein